jgi:Fe-S cluster biogenesis protein NfuA
MSSLPQYQPNLEHDDHERMQGLIMFLSSYVEQYHGGSVRLLEFDGKRLVVEMGGACIGCPLSTNTLRGWVEGTARQFFPDLEQVVGVEAGKSSES